MIDATAFKHSLNKKPVAVFGLGGSGIATVEWLVSADIETIAWDDNEKAQNLAKEAGANTINIDQKVLEECACLILAPGVPLTHPEPHDVVKAAHRAGIEIIGDLEVLHRCNHRHKTIGITGTNGKSTTTALITHVLKACGHDALMGGNIGIPALKLNPKSQETIFVLEMSSFQIDLCATFAPDIGILLNITPDHIDRHGTFENYASIKKRMVDGAKYKILAEDFSFERIEGHEFPMLPGEHNKQNIVTTLAVCDLLGIDEAKAIEAVKTFPGLAHRQFLVRTIGNVNYINDSKATNAEAASKALACYENIFWIVGGRAKDGGLVGLEAFTPQIKHAYLIGEAENDFAGWMDTNNVPFTQSETLKNATQSAHDDAQKLGKKATVLLSPACASFDQFKSFEARGDAFIKNVEELT